MDNPACPNCNMPRALWPEDGSGGHVKDGATYCCQGCIEGPGCTCIANNATPDPTTPTKDDIRDDAASAEFVRSLAGSKKRITPDDYGTEAVTKPPVSDYSND